MGLEIVLYGNNSFDNLIYSSKNFTPEELDNLDTQGDLVWDDFPNAEIICNYNNSIDSSYTMPETGGITGYEIQRRANGENYWTTIASSSYEEFYNAKVDEYFVLKDYNIRNNLKYYYRICALKNETLGTYIEGDILTKWNVFSLTPLVKVNKDQENILNVEYVPYTNANGESQVWTFYGDCEESALTKIQDKTQYDTFTRYPKFSIGQTNYFSLEFTALLGKFDENGQYYEPSYIIDRWNEFINLGLPCLYKNAKGLSLLVMINTDSAITFQNKYANYFLDEEEYVTNRPTTISVSLVEIGNAKNIIVSKVGE